MKAKTLCSVIIGIVAMAPLEPSAKTLGMVADNDTDSVTVFDADTHAILGSVPISPGDPLFSVIGDVLITPDLKRGFVTNLNNQVFVIDLTTSPPSLAAGTNPIPISTPGLDLSISPDGKFLVVVGGSAPSDLISVSVIEIAAQAEVSTFPGTATTSVDVCSDSSMLSASIRTNMLLRLTLSGAGTLTDTGETLSVNNPVNVYCAPGAQSGVAVTLLGAVTSFTIPGLSAVDTRLLPGNQAFTGAINPAGNRVFVRSTNPDTGDGSIDVFDFNPATGALGAHPLLTFSVPQASTLLGVEQIALHPNGSKLFVSEFGVLNVYDPNTGALLDSITDPNIVGPTGVTVVAEADPCALPPPAGAIVGTNGPNQINGTSGNDIIFGLGGSDQINGLGGNDLICGGAGSDQLNGGAGDDTIDGDAGSDQITGGAGDDVLNAQDEVNGNDSVNGGTHVSGDTCTADPGDAVSNCNP